MSVNRFLTIDIGASAVKVAEFVSSGPGNLSLVNFGCAAMDVDATKEEDINPVLYASLKKLIAERQFKAKRVALSVSGQLVLTRFMKLPAADEMKIHQMVKYEAAQNVPFPIEEVVWDYQVMGSPQASELDVAMVAIKSEIVEGFNRTMEQLGLRVELVDNSPLCVYNAMLYNYEVKEGDCLLLVDIGARTSNLIFVEPGKIFTRSLPIAGNTITQSVMQEFELDWKKAEELKLQQGFVGLGGAFEEPELESAARLCKIIRNVMTRLHADIARSITFYKTQQHGKQPKRFFLSGGVAITPYMDYFFKEKMEMEIEYFNPFKNVAIKLPPEDLEKVVHLTAEVVGLGLRMATECPIEINLIPYSVTKHRQLLGKIPYFAGSMLGVLLILLSWWLYYWKVTELNSNFLSKIEQEVQKLTAMEKEMKSVNVEALEINCKAGQLKAIVDARYAWIDFFEEFHKQFPSGLWITDFNLMTRGADGKVKPAIDFNKPGAQRAKGKVTDINITCSYLVQEGDPRKLQETFRSSFENSPIFKPIQSGHVVSEDDYEPGDWTMTFQWRPELKTPIPY